MSFLSAALHLAIAAGHDYVKATPENPNDWYPCGFAWLTYKCRKNAKESAILKEVGFRWDDYRKEYSLSGGTWSNTQAMDYKTAICLAVLDSLKESGYSNFGFQNRID